jgi:hypothetical protein
VGLNSKIAIAAILGGALAFGVAASLLPENAYQRWQLLDQTIHARAHWIYDRVHYDTTPIDVAFIGPSRVGQGINAPRLQTELSAQGRPVHVVNFSLPESGRDINYTITKELFSTKTPKLIVIGVVEKPSRFGHPAFKYVADRSDVVWPGYPADINYFSNLIYLPYRQLRLFMADIWPASQGLSKTFDPHRYAGESLDTTGSVVLPDGSIKEGEQPASAAELDRGVRKLERGMHPPILPKQFRDEEFGDDRSYVRRIVALAHAHGTRVAFVFIPYFTGPATVQEQAFYGQYGPVWNAGFLSNHAEWFADYGHLTRTGAQQLTDWLSAPISQILASQEPR